MAKGSLAAIGGAAMSLLVGVAHGQDLEENAFVLALRAAEANCRGAARETQQRIADAFYTQNDTKVVQVASAVVADFDHVNMGDLGNGYMLRDCDYTRGGMRDTSQYIYYGLNSLPDQPCDARGRCYPTLARYTRLGFPLPPDKLNPPSHGVIEATKNYQDRDITFLIAYLPRHQDTVDNVRQGQKISFRFRLFAIRDSRILGRLETLSPETSMLKCTNGHEFAPSAGYKFCPHDGLPLE